jgi:hypothetical protein
VFSVGHRKCGENLRMDLGVLHIHVCKELCVFVPFLCMNFSFSVGDMNFSYPERNRGTEE